MTAPTQTPVLGILNQHDNPHENWIAVLYSKAESVERTLLYWRYVAPRHNGSIVGGECAYPEDFTPLADFNVLTHMLPDARLGIHYIDELHPAFRLPAARYSDGRVRHWQGAVNAAIDMDHRAASFVFRAIRAEFEMRRKVRVPA